MSDRFARLDDGTLLQAFESGAIAEASWGHEEHLRVAYLQLARGRFEQALDAMRTGIRRLNAAHGVTDGLTSGYHETLTRAWLHLVDAARGRGAGSSSSVAFLEAHPELLEKTILRRHYSTGRIVTEDAKRAWVEPDLEPLPPIGPHQSADT